MLHKLVKKFENPAGPITLEGEESPAQASNQSATAYPKELAAHISTEGLADIWNKLDKSLTAQQKAGILGNMAVESQFNPNAVYGQYKGLVQMSSQLRAMFKKYYGDFTADNQIKYINDFVTGRTPSQFAKSSDDWKYNMGYWQDLYVKGDHRTAGASAETFMDRFERPGKKSTRERRKYAELIYKYMTSPDAPIIKAQKMNIPDQPISTIGQVEEKPDALRVIIPSMTIPLMQRYGGKMQYFK